MNRTPPLKDVNLLIIDFVDFADRGLVTPTLRGFGAYLNACVVIDDILEGIALDESTSVLDLLETTRKIKHSHG